MHTSDWHIGASKSVPGYMQRQSDAIDSIFQIAADRDVDTVLVAGDLFEISNPSHEERDFLLSKILEYDSLGFNILVIPGNHDLADMTGETALHYLDVMSEFGYFRNSLVTERTKFRIIDDTLFILLVHLPGTFNDEMRRVLSLAKNNTINADFRNVVIIAHETLRGSVTDSRFRIQGESAPKLEIGEQIDFEDYTYIALGDIHINQMVAPRAFYCGAPLQIRYNDYYPKGVFVVDTQDPDRPEFVPIHMKRLVTITPQELSENPTAYEDCWIKLSGQALITPDMPDNVVSVDFSRPPVIISENNNNFRDVLIESTMNQIPGVNRNLVATEVDKLLSNTK